MSDIENTENTNTEVQPTTDPYTEKAMEMGWRPQEEWDGAPEDFIDAKEFVRRQPLFEKIEHQNRDIKALKQAFDAFKQHHSKVKEAEYNRALATLKAEKRRALSEGETERALVIEDKMDEITEQKAQFDSETASQPQVEEGPRPEFIEWRQQNSWYGRDLAMTSYADKIGVDLAREGYSPAEVLVRVTREVKKEFAHKLTNQKRERVGAVESGSRSGRQSEPEFQMSDDERRIMNKIVSLGGITKEEYISELKRVRG